MNLIRPPASDKIKEIDVSIQNEEGIRSYQSTLDQKNAKILLYHYPSDYSWPVPRFSDQMIVAGPNLNKDPLPPHVKEKIHTPHGLIDLKPLLEKVSESFEPDILICWYDGINNGLRNIPCFKGIKAVIVGDYHHMHKENQVAK